MAGVGESVCDSNVVLLGLLTRRLWAIPAGAAAWVVLLRALTLIGIGEIPFATFLGCANMAAGVLAHRVVAWPVRRVRSVRAGPIT